MRLLLACLACAVGSNALHAQAQAIAQRHARIGKLYAEQRYAELIAEVDAQIAASRGTAWADSLHLYLYPYGRAHRKLAGAAAGTAAAERIYALVKERGNAAHEVEALFDLSWTYYDAGDLRQCARVDSIAVAVADRDPPLPRALRGRARQYLAFDHGMLGDHRSSADWALAAIAQYEQADSVPAAQWADSYTAVGAAEWHLGRILDAERWYNKALERLGEGGSEAILIRKADVHGNLGVLWQNAGDPIRAKASYRQSLGLANQAIAVAPDQSARDRAVVNRSRTCLNLATVYFQTGDNGTARELLDEAWRDRSSVLGPDDPQLLSVRERFADLELNAGNLLRAQTLQMDYLAAAERAFGPRSEELRSAWSKLGEIMAQQERFAAADSLFGLSLGALGPPAAWADAVAARTLTSRAHLYIKAHRWSDAIEDLGRARAALIAMHGPAHFRVAMVDVLRAEAAYGAGDLHGAEDAAADALRIVDDRVRALRADALPLAFPLPNILSDAIYWKVRAGMALAGLQPQAAQWQAWNADLSLAIQSLARNKAAMDDGPSKLQLVGAQERLFDLAIDAAFASREALGMQAAAERFLEVSEAGRSTLLKMRLNAFKGLRYAALPDSLAAREQELIASLSVRQGDDQAAIRLLAGESAYAAFLQRLERDYPAYFALRYGESPITIGDAQRLLLRPGRTLVAYANTASGLYALVITTERAGLVRLVADSLGSRVNALNAAIASRDAAAYVPVAHALHEQLIAPLRDRIDGHELLIIPDGPLHLLNPECLLTAPSAPGSFKGNLLLHRYAIASLLSATTAVQFAQLARERAQGALALAPGFTDEMKRGYRERVTDSSRIDRDYLRRVRQPFALRTAEGLGRTLHARLLLGPEATERAFRQEAARHGILHLGTHAEVNAADPMYSRLALSKEGEEPDPGDDGYLHAYEIYELDLRAQLAVLTACETGSGRESAGEGVRSLGYGFAYAGCPSLVTALWSIDEQSSSAIIARFYELLADGMPKHEALRQAKLDHLEKAEGEMCLPYYWAGLVLVGDVEPVSAKASVWPYAVGSILLAALAIPLLRRRRRGAAGAQ